MLRNEYKLVKFNCVDHLFIFLAFLTGSDRVPILGMKSMKVHFSSCLFYKHTENDGFDDFAKISDNFPMISE